MNIFAFSGLSVAVSCTIFASAILFFGKTRLHQTLMVFNIFVALWGFGLFLVGISNSETTALLGWKLAHSGGFFVGPTFYHFVTAFCGVRRNKLLIFGYLQSALFLTLVLGTDLLFHKTRTAFGLLYISPTALYLPGLFFYLAFVLYSYVELLKFLPSTKGRNRAQALYITLGFLVGFSGASTTFLPMYGIDIIYPSGNFGITIYCLILAYAILRHRIMDIHIVFRKSLAYALSAGFLTGIFILLVLASAKHLSTIMGISSFALTVIAALVIALMFAPLKNLLQAVLDRLFFKNAYDYSAVVQTTSRELLSTVDLEQNYRLVVDTLFETLRLKSVRLLSSAEDLYEAVYSVTAEERAGESAKAASFTLTAHSPLVALTKAMGIVIKDELAAISGDESALQAAEDMASLSCEAAVPILIDGEPKFLLLLGEKRSGDSFSPEDLNLLNTLSNQSAIALKNAALFADLSNALAQIKNEAKERTRAEDALRKAADNWRTTFDSTKESIIMLDDRNMVIRANRSASTFFGIPIALLSGKHFPELFRGMTSSGCIDVLTSALLSKEHEDLEVHFEEEDRWVHVTFDPLRTDPGADVHGTVCTIRDMTERKQLESQISQSRKMESIGRLAGGIAHDFNNLLFTIIGYSELALKGLDEESPQREKLNIVTEAAEKAAALTRQLLAFSRKQVLEMKPVDLIETVRNMTRILSRTIGEDITVEVRSKGVVGTIKADPVQIEQIIMNLALNARDAMPRGGRFVIEASSQSIEEEPGDLLDNPRAGDYVLLTVTDTGEGMPEEVLEKIFEPFFTTKETGKGTGLGLATVYGIVKQHDSHIAVSSTPGKGTTFKIYFPAQGESEIQEDEDMPEETAQGGSETVIVVEDDPLLLSLVLDTLEPMGYRVLSAGNGEEALAAIEAAEFPIDLLITDVIMPKMNGKELVERVSGTRPEMKVLYMSGYHDEIIGKHGVLSEGELFIQKPITPSKLSKRVREILDAPPEAAAREEDSAH